MLQWKLSSFAKKRHLFLAPPTKQTHLHQWKQKLMIMLCKKSLLWWTETVNKRVWQRMARVEMNSNLKKSHVQCFQVFFSRVWYCTWFEPRSHITSRWSMIVRVSVVLRRTVCVNIDRRFNNLSRSHHQSPLSSPEASYSRTLTARLGKIARRLGRGKNHSARGTLGRGFFPLPIVPRAPVFSLQRSRSRIFLSLVFTNRSLWGGERSESRDFRSCCQNVVKYSVPPLPRHISWDQSRLQYLPL